MAEMERLSDRVEQEDLDEVAMAPDPQGNLVGAPILFRGVETVAANPKVQGALERMCDECLQVELDANAAPEITNLEESLSRDELLHVTTFISPQDLKKTYEAVKKAVAESNPGFEITTNDAVLTYVNLFQNKLENWFTRALTRGQPYVPRMKEVFKDEGCSAKPRLLGHRGVGLQPAGGLQGEGRGHVAVHPGNGAAVWAHRGLLGRPAQGPRAGGSRGGPLFEGSPRDVRGLAALAGGLQHGRGPDPAVRTQAARRRLLGYAGQQTRFAARDPVSTCPPSLRLSCWPATRRRMASRCLRSPRLPPRPRSSWIRPRDLRVLAKCADVSVEALQEMNPSLRRIMTPPRKFDLKIPARSLEGFQAKLDALPESERVAVAMHTVARGEPQLHRPQIPRERRGHSPGKPSPEPAGRSGTSLVIPLGSAAADPSLYAEEGRAARKGGTRVYKVRKGRHPGLRGTQDRGCPSAGSGKSTTSSPTSCVRASVLCSMRLRSPSSLPGLIAGQRTPGHQAEGPPRQSR